MNDSMNHPGQLNRRQFLKQSGVLALGASGLSALPSKGQFPVPVPGEWKEI